MNVSGDAKIRAGTQDPKVWQLLKGDGITPISLEGVNSVKMRLRSENTGVVKEFTTGGKLEILSPATDGKVQLTPAIDDFSEIDTWLFHFVINDAGGNHPVPEDQDEAITVISNYS